MVVDPCSRQSLLIEQFAFKKKKKKQNLDILAKPFEGYVHVSLLYVWSFVLCLAKSRFLVNVV